MTTDLVLLINNTDGEVLASTDSLLNMLQLFEFIVK